MGLGFQLAESFSGSFYRLDDPLHDREARLALHLEVDGVRRFLRARRAQAEGRVFLEGLAEGDDGRGRLARGTVTLKLFDEKRIPYDVSFEGDDGRRYRLRGQRDFAAHDALDSLTILPASLYDDEDRELGRAMLRFDPRTELGPTLRSFRPRVRLHLLSRS